MSSFWLMKNFCMVLCFCVSFPLWCPRWQKSRHFSLSNLTTTTHFFKLLQSRRTKVNIEYNQIHIEILWKPRSLPLSLFLWFTLMVSPTFVKSASSSQHPAASSQTLNNFPHVQLLISGAVLCFWSIENFFFALLLMVQSAYWFNF